LWITLVSLLLLSGLIVVAPAEAKYTAYVSNNGQVTSCIIPANGITNTIDGQGNLIKEALNVGAVSVVVSAAGDLLEANGPGTRDYYTTGPRAGKIAKIGGVSFDYYVTAPRTGKISSVSGSDSRINVIY